MIEVTRLNGSIFFLNPDMILSLEATPDTVVTLTNGEKLVVKDPPAQIIDRFVAFKQRIVSEMPMVTPYDMERLTH
jgi:flagellar protein FlbD